MLILFRLPARLHNSPSAMRQKAASFRRNATWYTLAGSHTVGDDVGYRSSQWLILIEFINSTLVNSLSQICNRHYPFAVQLFAKVPAQTCLSKFISPFTNYKVWNSNWFRIGKLKTMRPQFRQEKLSFLFLQKLKVIRNCESQLWITIVMLNSARYRELRNELRERLVNNE